MCSRWMFPAIALALAASLVEAAETPPVAKPPRNYSRYVYPGPAGRIEYGRKAPPPRGR